MIAYKVFSQELTSRNHATIYIQLIYDYHGEVLAITQGTNSFTVFGKFAWSDLDNRLPIPSEMDKVVEEQKVF